MLLPVMVRFAFATPDDIANPRGPVEVPLRIEIVLFEIVLFIVAVANQIPVRPKATHPVLLTEQ